MDALDTPCPLGHVLPMNGFQTLLMAWRLARRDLRGGPRALWLLAAGVFVGVAATALVGAATHTLLDGARKGALEAVGGDVSVRLFHRGLSAAERAALDDEGRVSVITEARPMASANGNSALVELKGVDGAYPLYGAVRLEGGGAIRDALKETQGRFGAVADAALLGTLGIDVGDIVRVGDVSVQVRGVLANEPDRAFRAFTLGPRLMVANAALQGSAITTDGALFYTYARVRLDGGTRDQAQAVLARLDAASPDAGWRQVNAHDGVPGVERVLAMAHALLLFIGLGVLLVGGAGVAGAVRAHLSEKTDTIAVLKAMGAPDAVIVQGLGLQVLMLAGLGSVAGVMLGAGAPWGVVSALSDALPFALSPWPAAKPLFAALAFGVLAALLFAYPALMSVRAVKAQALFHDALTPARRRLGARGWVILLGLMAALLGVVFWASPLPVLTAGFLVAASVLTGVFALFAVGLKGAARRLARGRGLTLRLMLAPLHRGGAPTGTVVTALGLALTLLVALRLIADGAQAHMQSTLPDRAPDLVAFSLPAPVAERLRETVEQSGLARSVKAKPFVHARLQAVGGVALSERPLPRALQWVARGDRGVSIQPARPDGKAWTGAGFSLERSVAKRIGVGLGETLTLNLSGQVRTAPVTAFHDVDWNGLDLDFPIIASPAALSGVPHTFAAAIKAHDGQAAQLEDFLRQGFADVPLIRVADVLGSLQTALAAMITGLQAAVLMASAAALVVLAGSVLQGLRQRLNEAALLKAIGARRSDVLKIACGEFLLLSGASAILALPLGALAAHGVARAAGLDGVAVIGGVWVAFIGIAVAVAVALLSTLGAFTAKPARLLRGRSL